MGLFSKKMVDFGKLSEEELIESLSELQKTLYEKGCWTHAWLRQKEIQCPEPTDEEKRQAEADRQEMAKLTEELEAKRAQLKQLQEETEDAVGKHKALVQLISDEEKRLETLRKPDAPLTVEDLATLKEDVRQEIRQVLETLSDKIDNENRELVRVLDKTEDKLMRKEADVQHFQEDARLKATAPFLKQFIALGDMMRRVVEAQPDEAEASAAYFKQQLNQLTESVDYILRDFSVDVFRHNPEDDKFDPHTQQAFEYLTNDKSLDKKVRRTINPGYVWTLPYVLKPKANGEEHPLKEYRAIFRREQVECYKYVEQKL